MNSVLGYVYVVEKRHKGITHWVPVGEFPTKQEYKDCLERIHLAHEGCSRKQDYRVLLRMDSVVETGTFPHDC